MNRELMARQMFAGGGQVYKMQEGGVTPVNPMAGMPVSPDAAMPPMAGAAGVDPAMMEQMLMQAQQGITALDDAETAEEVMNAMRGDQATVEERRMELAQIVGEGDAQSTPESVLTLVQPVMMMAQVDQGIGGLAQDQMKQEVTGDMAGGIMSTVDMGAEEGPAPVNFKYGGAVKRMADGGAPTIDPALQREFEQQRAFYGQLLNKDAQTRALQGQQDLTQAQMLFDLAQTGLAIAAPGPRTMSLAEKIAYGAQQSQLFPKIGERAAGLEAFKQKQLEQAQQLDMAAAQGAMGLRNKQIEAGLQSIGTPYSVQVVGPGGELIDLGRRSLTRADEAELLEKYPQDKYKLFISPISTTAPKRDIQTLVAAGTGESLGSFDLNDPMDFAAAMKLKEQNKYSFFGTPKIRDEKDRKPYNLIKGNDFVAVIPGTSEEQEYLAKGYAVAGNVTVPNEYDYKGVKLLMDVVIDGKSYKQGQRININSRQLASLDPTAVDLSPMTNKDWMSMFKMTEEKYNSLTDNDKNILAGLANVEDYFSKFGMPKDKFMLLSEEQKLKLVGLAPEEKLITLADNSLAVVKGKDIEIIYTPDVFKIIKGENGELLRVNEQTGTLETLREAVASIKPEYRSIRDTRNDVVTYVDITTKEGQDAVAKASAENRENKGEVIQVRTLASDQPKQAKAFYIEGAQKTVLSFDGGRTYLDDKGNVKAIPTEGAVPLSDQIANEVLSRSRIRRVAGQQLSQMLENDVGMIRVGTRENPQSLNKAQRDNVRSAYKAALDGTGTWAKFQVFLDNVFAGALLPEDTFQDTQSNRQFLETIKILGRSALVLNPRFPVAEMTKVEGLFPDTDAMFVNPKTQANKLVELKDAAINQKASNLYQLQNQELLDAKDVQEIISNNAEIDRLLGLLEGVPDRMGESQAQQSNALSERLKKQRDRRKLGK